MIDIDSLPWVGLDSLREVLSVVVDALGRKIPKVRDVAEDVHGIHVKVLIPNSVSVVFDSLDSVAEAYAYIKGGRVLRGAAAEEFREP